MASFVALMRGINVGGRNPVSMAELAGAFGDAGHADVRTHGRSGNVLFTAGGRATASSLEPALERMLEERFGFPILVVVRSRDDLAATIEAAPPDHGSATLRSEVFFVRRPLTADAVFAGLPELRDGVDSMTVGPGALYFSRVAARATKTRITRLMAMPVFQCMTVRTWRTTTHLLDLLDTG